MSDDGTSGFDEGIAGLENLIENFGTIERKALLAAAEAVAPRLIDATPVRVSEKQGGNSLPEYALKGAVRATVQKDRESGELQAVCDFGSYTHIAHMVDIGHDPPHSRLATKLNRTVSGKPTPAHPFVRNVQDSQQKTAQAAYKKAMTEGMGKALQGQ